MRDHFLGFAQEFYLMVSAHGAIEYICESVRVWSAGQEDVPLIDEAPPMLGDDPLAAKHAALVALHDCVVATLHPIDSRTGAPVELFDPLDGAETGDAATYYGLGAQDWIIDRSARDSKDKAIEDRKSDEGPADID